MLRSFNCFEQSLAVGSGTICKNILDVEIGSACEFGFRIAQIDTEFGLERAVLFLDVGNSARIEVYVNAEIGFFERSVVNVCFQIKRNARQSTDFAQIESEHVFDESDNVFGDKTLDERNERHDKSEIARYTQNLTAVAVVHERALA